MLTQRVTRVRAVVLGLAVLGTAALMGIQAAPGWGRQQATGSGAAVSLEGRPWRPIGSRRTPS